jgi:hypothetical protein
VAVPTEDFAHLQLPLTDRTQWRYDVIRPVVLFADRTLQQRSRETQPHPATVRRLTRRFRQQGMLGLLPADVEVVARGKTAQIPAPVRHELDRLKALYDRFHYRELARILLVKLGYRLDDKTVKQLWQASPVRCQGPLGLWESHTHPDRYQARLQVVTRYDQGWEKISIHPFLPVSRPTVDAWIRRFETAHFAGLTDRSRAPHAPVRKIWLPLMAQVYHLQKVHPDAGAFRIWSLLARADLSVRTIGRVMALNRLVYDDIPHVPKRGVKPAPGPHPYKAQARQQYWFIDGRRMDVAIDGGHWWSLMLLEGYSRTMLAGMIAPTEATWVALMVLYTACLHYGAPAYLVSDGGDAYTSADFEAGCTRPQIRHETIISTQGESDQNWMETHFTVQRRLYDDQFSRARTPTELEQRHRAFIQLYNTTAHQGLLKDRRLPPIPIEVLGAAKGRLYAPDELARQFSHALFPRTTNRHGCVTLHSDHCSVEEGLLQTQVLLWMAGTHLRAMFEGVVLAEDHCRSDWRDRHVTESGAETFHPTRVASPQGRLIPLTPAASVVVYRTRAPRRQAAHGSTTPQRLLFEVVQTG